LTISLPRFRHAFIAIGIASAFAPSSGRAHPHVWVDVRNEIHVTDSGLISAISVVWSFDEFYTAFAIQGLDLDGDGTYSPAELQELANINMAELEAWDYMMAVNSQPGHRTPRFATPTNAVNQMLAGRLELRFTLPLAEPVSAPLSIATYDPTFYVAMPLLIEDEDAVTLIGPGAGLCEAQVVRRADAEVFIADVDMPTEDELAQIAFDLADRIEISCPN